jgi:pyruvate kinase
MRTARKDEAGEGGPCAARQLRAVMNDSASRKRTKIVATIGPASRDPQILRDLFLAGVNVVRLNFSHGTHAEHAAVIADVRRVAEETGTNIGILQDLPGPKVRTGPLGNGLAAVRLEPGKLFGLTTQAVAGSADEVSVSYAGLPRDVEPGKLIYLADGAIALRVLETSEHRVVTRVVNGGDLRATQGINYPDGTLRIDAVTDKDFEHLSFGLSAGIDWVAISFVRSAEDVRRVRAFITERGHDVPIIAKIEKHEALSCIDEIVRVADAIMVARGDLGVEIPLEQVPLIQKDLIARANRANKPVITATQMLESMIAGSRPTRAEAADVANAILDGTDAVMLSGETARGAYPVEAVRVMATIAEQIERRYPHDRLRERRLRGCEPAVATMIAEAAARVAQELNLRVIAAGTTTGSTAILISSFRPHARIFALTPIPEVARRLALAWGVEAMLVEPYHDFETLISLAQTRILQNGIGRSGEDIAITFGLPMGAHTNVLKVHRLP